MSQQYTNPTPAEGEPVLRSSIDGIADLLDSLEAKVLSTAEPAIREIVEQARTLGFGAAATEPVG